LHAAPAPIEFHEAVDQGVEGVVAPLSDTRPGLEDRAQLPDEDVASPDLFAAESFHATTLGIGIPSVATGSLTFLMCHLNT